jgi:hypothetical protein
VPWALLTSIPFITFLKDSLAATKPRVSYLINVIMSGRVATRQAMVRSLSDASIATYVADLGSWDAVLKDMHWE